MENVQEGKKMCDSILQNIEGVDSPPRPADWVLELGGGRFSKVAKTMLAVLHGSKVRRSGPRLEHVCRVAPCAWHVFRVLLLGGLNLPTDGPLQTQRYRTLPDWIPAPGSNSSGPARRRNPGEDCSIYM